MKASDAIAKVLSANNVTVGFELMGGMIAHLIDSINVLGESRLVSLHHEQAAAFAAGGVARSTKNNQVGFALGTSGPGATNLVTGIADCWLDNYPCIFITGQVNTYEQKGELNIRQQGFQELDIVSIVKSITKYAVLIKKQEDIIPELQKAIDIAKTGRPGPVLIDIPMDLQRAELADDVLSYIENSTVTKLEKIDIAIEEKVNIEKAVSLISKAEKPLFLIGGGAVNEPSFIEWQKNISKLKIPHVASLKGSEKTAFKPGYFGMIGAYGTRTANYSVQESDLIVVLGSRLDVRQTGVDVDDFARNAKTIVQLDLEADQLNNRVKGHLNIQATCENFFLIFNDVYKSNTTKCEQWLNELKDHWKKTFINEYPELKISPFNICKILCQNFIDKKVQYVTDVGNNQMWAAHSLLLGNDQAIHHSGGLGAMGFGIPTSIGVQYATQGMVVSISGDGGAQLNIQELDIISRDRLPILTIIVNNKSLGMVRTFQEMYFEGRNQSTFWDGYTSSFSEIGKAYNMYSVSVSTEDDFERNVQEFIKNPQPMLLELIMDDARECKPRLTFGHPIDKQYPLEN